MRPQIKADLNLSRLEHPALDAADLHIIGDMVSLSDGTQLTLTGETKLMFSSLNTAQLTTGAGEINWEGRINHDKALERPLTFKGDWSSDIKKLSVPDPIRRRDLSQTLSLSQALSKTPIAENFGPELTRNIHWLLKQSDMQGAAQPNLPLTDSQ